jgi:transcriptional regulator of the spore photoproduct lyase operon
MDIINPNDVKAGDEVFVIYRNPHIPTVANVKSAEIVEHPKDPNAVALFLNETFHTIEDEDLLFTSEAAAERAYEEIIYGDSFDE